MGAINGILMGVYAVVLSECVKYIINLLSGSGLISILL